MAVFAYNNSYQETIKTTPFYANYRVNPEHQLIMHMMTGKNTSATGMKELHDTLQAEMTTAQLQHKENYDHYRKPDPNLKPENMVWLLPCNIHTTRPSRKLDWKKIGPFKIIAKIGSNAYKLDLPPLMRIHNTFHISLLEPHENNKFPFQIQEPPPPIQIGGEDEYELDEIMDSRLHYNKLRYRAKWTGYPPEHDKVWYPASNFEHANNAIERFHHHYPPKPGRGNNSQN